MYQRGFRISIAALIVAFAMLPRSAAARWEATIEHDDFGDNHVGLAATMSEARGLVLRCENKKVPMIIFGTREQWADGLGALPATLLIKVDNGESFEQRAVLEDYPMLVGLTQQSGVRVVSGGDHVFPVIEAIAKAKSRIAVAVEIAGKRFENTRFSARGSHAAFKRIWQFCGSSLGDYKKREL